MINIIKKLNIFIIRFLLFFYLTSSYLSATHIHKDISQQHSDCKVSILVKNLHSPDIPHNDIYVISDNYYEKIRFYQDIVANLIFKGFNSQAPPIFS